MHATEVGRRLLFADDPDPRVLQGVFFALLSLDYLLRSVDGTPIELRSWPALGYALAVALTIATFAGAVAPAVPRRPSASSRCSTSRR